jgi:hypothetical protein
MPPVHHTEPDVSRYPSCKCAAYELKARSKPKTPKTPSNTFPPAPSLPLFPPLSDPVNFSQDPFVFNHTRHPECPHVPVYRYFGLTALAPPYTSQYTFPADRLPPYPPRHEALRYYFPYSERLPPFLPFSARVNEQSRKQIQKEDRKRNKYTLPETYLFERGNEIAKADTKEASTDAKIAKQVALDIAHEQGKYAQVGLRKNSRFARHRTHIGCEAEPEKAKAEKAKAKQTALDLAHDRIRKQILEDTSKVKTDAKNLEAHIEQITLDLVQRRRRQLSQTESNTYSHHVRPAMYHPRGLNIEEPRAKVERAEGKMEKARIEEKKAEASVKEASERMKEGEAIRKEMREEHAKCVDGRLRSQGPDSFGRIRGSAVRGDRIVVRDSLPSGAV